jgi:hypothetical protein
MILRSQLPLTFNLRVLIESPKNFDKPLPY